MSIHDLPDLPFHGLRHTNAPLLLEGGVPMKVISQRLGHARIARTMDTYAHLRPPTRTDD